MGVVEVQRYLIVRTRDAHWEEVVHLHVITMACGARYITTGRRLDGRDKRTVYVVGRREDRPPRRFAGRYKNKPSQEPRRNYISKSTYIRHCCDHILDYHIETEFYQQRTATF